MDLLNLTNLDCDIISIKVNGTKETDTDNSDSTTIVTTLRMAKKSITKDERFNVQYQQDDDCEHIFNQYSFSTQQFDAVGSFFNEISVQKNRATTIYIPYEIWWGMSYNSDDTCDMVVFTSIPQNSVFDIESILQKTGDGSLS